MNYSDSIDLIERIASLQNDMESNRENQILWDSDPKKGTLYGTNNEGKKIIDFRVPITFPTLPKREDEKQTISTF